MMKATNITIEPKTNEASFLTKEAVKIQLKMKRAEAIAWAIFFGIGVGYFVATLMLAI